MFPSHDRGMQSNRYRKFFSEHGYIHTLMYIRPKTVYSQGLEKHWFRSSKEDYWQKEFQKIGMQEIYNKEVYAGHTTPDGTFAYQDRYDEYRKSFSKISGDFHANENLEHWHMAREFTSDPAFNSTFVTANPTNRVYASTTDDQLYVFAHHNLRARRLLARDGTPGGIL